MIKPTKPIPWGLTAEQFKAKTAGCNLPILTNTYQTLILTEVKSKPNKQHEADTK